MKLKFKIFIILLAGVFWSLNASASALKVAPSSLNFEAIRAKAMQKVITVENPGQDAALFEIYPDDFSGWISVNPASFVLNPGDKKEVLVSANFKSEGIYAAFLSVVSKPLSQIKFETNAGVKIPLEIRVSKDKSGFWLASISENARKLFDDQQDLIYILIIICILVFFGFLTAVRFRKKTKLQ